MSRNKEAGVGDPEAGLDVAPAKKEIARPTEDIISRKAQEIIVNSSAVADMRRFASGSGETRRADDREDYGIRNRFYKGWTTEDFGAMIAHIDGLVARKKEETQLAIESQRVAVESSREVKKRKVEVYSTIQLSGIDQDTRSEMYQNIIGLDDEDFDPDEYITKYNLPKDQCSSWDSDDWHTFMSVLDNMS